MLILIATLSIIGISLVVLIPGMDINSVSISNSTTNTESINPVYTLVGEEENRNIVPPELIVNGGPPPDGIPSIDNPKFIQIRKAEEFLEDSDLVVGLNINGDIRAYPLQILVWHEIVNDKVGNTPVAVTYCPLCFTNQVFNRTMNDGQILEFGTSGKLYNSNLVMYDRTTKSLWSQAMAQGIGGTFAGIKLERIPFDVAYWKEWKQLYPDSKVLSTDTGSTRPYGADPYGDYYTNGEILFPVSNSDDRVGLKEIVIGLENKGQYKAFKLQEIEGKRVINNQVNGKPIVLLSLHPFMARVYDPVVNGQTLEFNYNIKDKKFVDKQTNSMWNFDGKSISGQMKGKQLTRLSFDEGFWFEWVAFHPKTELYDSSNNDVKSAG
ncbi:MAG: hypothetical protein K0S67_107 [Nitrososphaeraceae archaeon]|jgi:hypothetical protein|nr:hypothetical protein [Nitrososphaeraceae archaeon]MCD6036223.1 hypothetical protein [Nitrososphaeraceae archaeon]MDF2767525.1 hypothetical protein [Nitrososphaeraceae archaeon]